VYTNSVSVEQLGEYIVKGLARHHWGLEIGANTFVRATFLRQEGTIAFDRFSLDA
jgi:hypothetical protein